MANKVNFRTEATAKQIIALLSENSLYHDSRQQNYNSNVDRTNKVVTLFGTTPINRAELWLDATSIVMFFGENIRQMIETAFSVLEESETVTEEQKKAIADFRTVFEETVNTKYRISRAIETKHNFKSYEAFKSFIENSNSIVLTAIDFVRQQKQTEAEQQTAEAEATEAEQTAEAEQTEATAEQQTAKQKSRQKQNRSNKKQQKSAK